MKRIIATALAIGVIAAPAVVFAQHGADDTPAQVAADVRQEDRQNDAVPAPTPAASTVTAESAQATAVAQHPNATVKEVEHETEHGASVFSVKFNDGSRVDVDDTTGQVVQNDQNDNDDQDDEDDNNAQDDHGHHSGRSHTEDNDNSGRGHAEDN